MGEVCYEFSLSTALSFWANLRYTLTLFQTMRRRQWRFLFRFHWTQEVKLSQPPLLSLQETKHPYRFEEKSNNFDRLALIGVVQGRP